MKFFQTIMDVIYVNKNKSLYVFFCVCAQQKCIPVIADTQNVAQSSILNPILYLSNQLFIIIIIIIIIIIKVNVQLSRSREHEFLALL